MGLLSVGFVACGPTFNDSPALGKGRVISQQEAVGAAESFIRMNGYTEAAPDPGPLDPESLEWSQDRSEVLKHRANTLEAKAYGVIKTDAGWSVVFLPVNAASGDAKGRAVTMDVEGGSIKVQHDEIVITPRVKRINR
jgi:hypothetical protein